MPYSKGVFDKCSLHIAYIKPTFSLHSAYTKTAKKPKIATKLVTLRRAFQVSKPS